RSNCGQIACDIIGTSGQGICRVESPLSLQSMLGFHGRCGMPIQCQKCPYMVAVPPGEKRPAWCPRCGADLKEAAQKSMGAVASRAMTAANGVRDEPKAASPLADERTPRAPAQTPLPGTPTSMPETSGEVFGGKLVWH